MRCSRMFCSPEVRGPRKSSAFVLGSGRQRRPSPFGIPHARGKCDRPRPQNGGGGGAGPFFMKKLVASDIPPATSWSERSKSIFQAYEKSRPQGGSKSRPSEAVVIWKGGARERADDVFFAMGIKRRGHKANFVTTWRRWRDSNSRAGLSRPTAFRVRTLQPLGYISVF